MLSRRSIGLNGTQSTRKTKTQQLAQRCLANGYDVLEKLKRAFENQNPAGAFQE